MQTADTLKDTRGSAGARVTVAPGMGPPLKNGRLAAARERLSTKEVGQGDRVGRQGIELPPVGPSLGGDVHQGESELREAADQIVDPGRHAALHVRVRSF